MVYLLKVECRREGRCASVIPVSSGADITLLAKGCDEMHIYMTAERAAQAAMILNRDYPRGEYNYDVTTIDDDPDTYDQDW